MTAGATAIVTAMATAITTAAPATDGVTSVLERSELELVPVLEPCYALLASTPGGEGHDATNR